MRAGDQKLRFDLVWPYVFNILYNKAVTSVVSNALHNIITFVVPK